MKSVHDEIEEWVGGALCESLHPEERKSFETHLANCEACRTYYQEEKRMSELIAASLESEGPSPDFEQRMVLAFRGRPEHWLRRLGAWMLLSRSVQLTGAMAALLALVQIGSLVTQERATSATRKAEASLPSMEAKPHRFLNGSKDLGDSSNVTDRAFEKSSARKLTLGGTNTYTGTKTVTAGEAQVPESATPTNALAQAFGIQAETDGQVPTLGESRQRALKKVHASMGPAATPDGALSVLSTDSGSSGGEQDRKRISLSGSIANSDIADNRLGMLEKTEARKPRIPAVTTMPTRADGAEEKHQPVAAPANASPQTQPFLNGGVPRIETKLDVRPEGTLAPANAPKVANAGPVQMLARGFDRLMWSARMIGVALAFLAPWGVAVALLVWIILKVYWSRADRGR